MKNNKKKNSYLIFFKYTLIKKIKTMNFNSKMEDNF